MKHVRHLTALAAAALLLAGCAVGPDTGPNIVRGDHDNASADTEQRQPELSAPSTDLNWKPCSSRLAKLYSTTAPKGVDFDCARMDVRSDAGGSATSTMSVGVVRARTDATPKKVAPLVLTSGVDLASSRTLLQLASSQGKSLLDRRPVVALDHRGLGTSGLVDCLTTPQRKAYATDAAAPGRDVDARAQALSGAANKGADQCNDTLNPDQLQYSVARAASDVEELRSRWDVDRLALLGVGDGSSVVLAYAAEHADNVGRIVLDSPSGYNVNAKDSARVRARGLQATLTAFAQRCVSADCGLGGDAPAVLSRLLSSGAGGDGALSDSQVLAAITTALATGDTSPAGLKKLGGALAAADRGDVAALRSFADEADKLRLSDGQIVSTCNDLRGRPGTGETAALAKEWSADSPLTATVAALGLVRCDGWGVADAPPAPESLPVNPVILIGQNDPINGAAAVDTLTPLLLATNTKPTRIAWDGLGFSVAANSDCAASTIVDYLRDEPLSGPTDRSCPA